MNIKKYKLISRYIGITVLALFIVGYLIYKISPTTYATLGIDIQQFAKYTIAFFIIKGCITTSIILYGIYAVRKKMKKNQ